MLTTILTAQAIDDVLAGTFPASDPPAWTPGIARPAPQSGGRAAERDAIDETNDVRVSDVSDVSRPARVERTFAQALVSLLGAAGLALVITLAILAIVTPIALVLGGVLELADWLVRWIL